MSTKSVGSLDRFGVIGEAESPPYNAWDEQRAWLDVALDTAKLGVWRILLPEKELVCSEGCRIHFGVAPDDDLTFEMVVAMIRMDDRSRVVRAIDDAIAKRTDLSFEYQIEPKNGGVRWLLSRGRVVCDSVGTPVQLLGVSVDLTERVLAERALRVSEERLRLALENAHSSAWEWDTATNEIFWSDNSAAMYGLPEGVSRFPGEEFLTLVHPDDHQMLLDASYNALESGNGYNVVFRMIGFGSGDQSIQWLEANGKAADFDADGRPRRFLGVTTNVTQRKRAEDELREREDRFRSLANAIPALIWQTDETGELTFINDQMRDYTGCGADSDPCLWLKNIHPDDLGSAKIIWDAALAERKPFGKDYRLLRHDGIYRWMHDQGTPRFSRDGRFLGFIGVAFDVTERRQAEEQIRASEARNRAILEAIPDLMFLQTSGGDYIECHAPLKELYKPPEEFLGKNMRDILPPDIAETFAIHFERIMRTNELQSAEYILPIQGEVRNYEARMIRSGDDQILSLVRDITERKRAEAELELLTDQLLHTQEEERRRIANELHENTAQNLVAICLNLAHMQQMVAPGQDELHSLLGESRALGEQVLREIRTLSYLLHPPALEGRSFSDALIWYVEGFAKRSGIAISTTFSDNLGEFCPIVESALFRVVQESLTNIHRHSGANKAEIQLSRTQDSILLTVEDFGRGSACLMGNKTNDRVELMGVGITGMRQRMTHLDGQLTVSSGSGGTIVTASVPAERAVTAV